MSSDTEGLYSRAWAPYNDKWLHIAGQDPKRSLCGVQLDRIAWQEDFLDGHKPCKACAAASAPRKPSVPTPEEFAIAMDLLEERGLGKVAEWIRDRSKGQDLSWLPVLHNLPEPDDSIADRWQRQIRQHGYTLGGLTGDGRRVSHDEILGNP